MERLTILETSMVWVMQFGIFYLLFMRLNGMCYTLIKNLTPLGQINSLQVEKPRLPKSKSYLKIIGILFFPYVNSQEKLSSNNIETILKQNHIFNNISLASKPRVIKVSLKSDMAIVWIDIWDIQSGVNAKMLINRCFNIGNYIVTIRGANMNPGVPQCKNCWKWGHSTFSCRVQGTKCIKCNGPHKSEHHHKFGWCCKANAKTNPPGWKLRKANSIRIHSSA